MADGGFSTDGGQTLNPDGTVSYTFAGHINAEGLDLKAYNVVGGSGGQVNLIRWLTNGGASAADLFALTPGLASVTDPNSSMLRLEANDLNAGRGQSAHLDLNAGAVNNVSAGAGAAGGQTRRIIDAAGGSDFLQLSTARQQAGGSLEFEIGQASTVIAGNGTPQCQVRANHALGRAPVAFLGTAFGQNANGRALVCSIANFSSSILDFVVQDTAFGNVTNPIVFYVIFG